MNKTLFCAYCQEEKLHGVTVHRGEIIFTCDCGRFKKFSADLSAAELTERVAGHKAANQGLRLVKTEADQIEVGGMSKAEIDAALASIEALS
jgi:hypothetical protein